MSETMFPRCPNCKKEVLIPFSVSQVETAKTFAHWVCLNCGFCVGTGDSRGCNPPRDILVDIVPEIVERVKKAFEKGYKHK